MITTPTTTKRTAADPAEIRRALDLLTEPGSVIEIRAPEVPGRGKKHTVAGYFLDRDKATKAAMQLDKQQAEAVYVVLNELDPELLPRSPDQLTEYLEPTTSDNNILRRRWLYIDLDPDRPAKVSSTDEQHAAARAVAEHCRDWLHHDCGWPDPIFANSGNGWHLLYRIDLPNNKESLTLVSNVLTAIGQQIGTPQIKVDQSTKNAARICKLYGTYARKGHPMPDRPHRLARLVDVPPALQTVTREKLEALAATVAKPEPAPTASNSANGEYNNRLDLPKWLSARGVAFKRKDSPSSDGRTVYLLAQCPFDASHGKGNEVSIMQDQAGKLSATCMHNSCQGRGWKEFRDAIGKPDPDHYDPPYTNERNGNGSGKGGSGSAKIFRVDAVCIRADTIKPRKIRWLWQPRFARGKYNEVIGQPGLGKSLLLVDITARVTRGLPFPDEAFDHEPADVVLLSAEDDPEDTTVPRLITAGADLTRVHILTAVSAPDKTGIRPVSLDTDIAAVERLLETLPAASLLVIDPIAAYCGKADSHKGAEVRALLVPLTTMAQRRDIAVVGITHFNKGGSGPAVTRGLGSIAWTAAARMSWAVVRDTDDPRSRLFLPIKCNLAADISGLSYGIVDVDGVPQIAWSDAPVTKSVDEVLSQQERGSRSPRTNEAIEWLRELLANGRRPAKEIKDQAKAIGHPERAVNAAKVALGITPYAEGFGKSCVWYWSLPEATE